MPAEPKVVVPTFEEFLSPIVEVLRDVVEPMPNDELDRAVARRMKLSDAVLGELHDPERSDQPEVFYRMAWSRTYLKKAGLLDNPKRGCWILTPAGRRSGPVDAEEIVTRVRAGVEPDAPTTELPDHVAEELLGIHKTVISQGGRPTGEALEACYRRFREKFGPDVLKNLDGEEMLSTMHGRRGSKDSLVYWLEFKNDDEFPAVFGSIAGGSALKFTIYQNTETGEWITGSPRAQRRLSIDEAVALVRRQRDELVAGASHLLSLARDGATVDYSALEQRMNQLAPELAKTAWGHKYFALLAPTILDDYHAIYYQDFHLIKLHKLPLSKRYENARFFVAIAKQLGMPVTELSTALNRRNGSPHSYWRVATSTEGAQANEWPRMRDGGFAAMGWSEIGSLKDIEGTKQGKDQVRALVEKHFPRNGRADELFGFAASAARGDLVVAMQGQTVLGIGEITSDYYYQAGDGPLAHRRTVTWKSVEEWPLPEKEAQQTTFKKLTNPVNLVAIERGLSEVAAESGSPHASTPPPATRPPLSLLTGVMARVDDALRRKGQVILYGPPGTGKTHWAMRSARELAARSWFGASYDSLNDTRKAQLAHERAIEQCCFHPNYGYEDFLVGYRPTARNGALSYEVSEGVFARVCKRATDDPQRAYYLLIDEINRGDIPRIFGELLMALEKDKRATPISVPLLDRPLIVPTNVFVIGTMNTADRSVALLDAALRRRFAFIELMPDTTELNSVSIGGLPLGPWLTELNQRVMRVAGRDARNLQIGHAYLMHGGEPIRSIDRFAETLRDDIIPLLQEYCYEDFGALEQILGSALVLGAKQQFKNSLFEPGKRQELVEALLVAFPEITATRAAANAEREDPQEESEDDERTSDGEALRGVVA